MARNVDSAAEAMNRRFAAIAFVALGLTMSDPSPLFAQGAGEHAHVAQPERPTIATHAHTVAPGYVEIETGVQGYHPETGETEYDTPSLVKIGLTSHLQLDVYEGTTALSQSAYDTFGLGDMSTGIKWRVLDGAAIVGDFAVQTTLKLPTGSVEKGAGTGTTDLNLTLISSHDFGAASLDVNLGWTARSGDGSVAPTRATLWTVSWGLPLRDRIGWAAEIFGYPGTRGASGDAPVVAVLTGPTCVIRSHLVIDAGVIVRLAGPQATTGYAGLTWNIGRLWGPRSSPSRTARPSRYSPIARG